MNEMERPYHEVANIFPLLDGADYQQLKDDIECNGQIEPIWLHPDGSIIDGRNRHRACIELDVEPVFRVWGGGGSLLSHVVSLNLIRRQLSSSQRAAIALDVLPMLEREARERMLATQNNSKAAAMEIIPEQVSGNARDQAAALFGTNGRYVQDAKNIKEKAPDLYEQVKNGVISIPKANEQINRPHVANNSGNNEWYTPIEFIRAAREVMGSINLDPASSEMANEVVGAGIFYTAENNGLDQAWFGNIWLNPPYAADLVGRFIDKLCYHWQQGNIQQATVLVNNATETAWFQQLAEQATAVCFPRRRVKFWRPDGETGSPLQGQAVLYLGENVKGFFSAFGEFGLLCSIR